MTERDPEPRQAPELVGGLIFLLGCVPAVAVAKALKDGIDPADPNVGGIAKLAENTSLNREHLYRMLSENGNPELRSLELLLDALGFRLSISLKEAG